MLGTALVLSGCSQAPSRAIEGRTLPRAASPAPVVDAHDGSIVQDGGTYWLFGTAYDCGFALNTPGTRWCGIRAFSSNDLLRWEDRGHAVAPTDLWQTRCAPPLFGCFRAHVARSPADGRWVLWVNTYDAPVGYRVLVADSPAGPWAEVAPPVLSVGGHTLPSRGDHDVFVDSAGRGWIAYTVIEGGSPVDIAIEPLNPALTSGAGAAVRLGLGIVEAPSLFEREGRFFLTYSDPACPYCPGTGTGIAVAPSPMGPWRKAPTMSAKSCDGQPSEVTRLRLADETIWLYVSDQWDGGKANQSNGRIWWEALRFGANGMPLPLHCGA